MLLLKTCLIAPMTTFITLLEMAFVMTWLTQKYAAMTIMTVVTLNQTLVYATSVFARRALQENLALTVSDN